MNAHTSISLRRYLPTRKLPPVLKAALCLMAACAVSTGVAHGQAPQSTSIELDTALANARAGHADVRDVVVIADARAVQAVPALEEQFRHTTDVDTKVEIASGLVKLKDRDDTYWNFLLNQATLAIESDIPDEAYSQSLGKLTDQSPELQAWANAHAVSYNAARIRARYDVPTTIGELATTGDPRGVPLLRRALQSRNYLVVSFAAKGLTEIRDKESIPLIIAAARKAPIGYNSLIAEPLVYFDDVLAQNAFDSYVPKDQAALDRQDKARGRGVFGW